jgi:hypothetical protein
MRFEVFFPRSSFLGLVPVRRPPNCSAAGGRLHDSFNFDAELKETLNESLDLTVPPTFPASDKEFKISRLRESGPELSPWHIGCKLFRRFKQISL